ncbi:hypothetical protein PTI98_009198 [Pleurotus ostreatus]|nr:hypothetical protein PTI98_009198 [Pleurotus ostreatus]
MKDEGGMGDWVGVEQSCASGSMLDSSYALRSPFSDLSANARSSTALTASTSGLISTFRRSNALPSIDIPIIPAHQCHLRYPDSGEPIRPLPHLEHVLTQFTDTSHRVQRRRDSLQMQTQTHSYPGEGRARSSTPALALQERGYIGTWVRTWWMWMWIRGDVRRSECL